MSCNVFSWVGKVTESNYGVYRAELHNWKSDGKQELWILGEFIIEKIKYRKNIN